MLTSTNINKLGIFFYFIFCLLDTAPPMLFSLSLPLTAAHFLYLVSRNSPPPVVPPEPEDGGGSEFDAPPDAVLSRRHIQRAHTPRPGGWGRGGPMLVDRRVQIRAVGITTRNFPIRKMGYYLTPNPASDEKLLLPSPQDLATFRCCGFSIVDETVAPTVLWTGATVHRTPKEYFYVSDRKR